MWRRFFEVKVFRKQDRPISARFIAQLVAAERTRSQRALRWNPSLMAKTVLKLKSPNISKHGIWLLTRDHELFISFKEFPWFQDASVRKLMHVELPTPTCLHWPDLDIDLAVESIRCFPLLSQTSRPATRSSRQVKTEPITQPKSDLRSGPLRTSPKDQSTSFPRAPHFPAFVCHPFA